MKRLVDGAASAPGLGRNVAVTYLSQLSIAAMGILVMPAYFRAMSAEAYGMVGLFVVLQAWFNLLDLGLSPSVARETARFRGGSLSALDLRVLVRALQTMFAVVGLLGCATLLLLSGNIADHWLGANALPRPVVVTSMQLMAGAVALRWMAGLYRGIVTGFERLAWLGGFNVAVAMLRFPGALAVLWYVDASPVTFLAYQLLIAFIELIWVGLVALRALPDTGGHPIAFKLRPVALLMRFSALVAVSGLVSALLTQTDKLILSQVLTLGEYGRFTLAVVAANGVLLLGLPIGSAIMPRLAKLEAEGEQAALIDLYRTATQVVAVLAGAVTVAVVVGAYPLLLLWTGDAALARAIAPVFALYALGNGIMSVAAFPYYLQYAKGDLRLHIIGNVAFAAVLVPTIIWSASNWGMLGAATVWAASNAVLLGAWLPLVHRRFAPGLNRLWYGIDLGAILMPLALAGWIAWAVMPLSPSRGAAAPILVALGAILLLIGLAASSRLRHMLAFERLRA